MYIKDLVRMFADRGFKVDDRLLRSLCEKGDIGAERVPMITKNGKVIRQRWDIADAEAEYLLDNWPLTNTPIGDNVRLEELLTFLMGDMDRASFAKKIGVDPISLGRGLRGVESLFLYRRLYNAFPEYRTIIVKVAFELR